MRKAMLLGASLLVLTVNVGCDWTFGGGTDSWNERWNWVNFSGVYRGVGGGMIVTDFTATPGTPGQTITVGNERIATGTAAGSVYGGVLRNQSIVPGSLTINAGQFALTDDGNGVLSGGAGTSGTIDYGSGGWSINLQSSPGQGTAITASYQHLIEGTEGSPVGSGATRFSIRTLTIHQEGEQLVITDNNGAQFTGKMGSIRGSAGFDGDGPRPAGETIIAQFQASGTSAAGLEVKMTGTFEGTLGAAGEGGSTLANRRISGTWIESGGRTGDINGFAGNIIVIPAASTAGSSGGASE